MGTSLSQDVSQFDFNIPADAYTSYASTPDANEESFSANNDSSNNVKTVSCVSGYQ